MKENQKRNYSFIAKSLVMFVAVFGLFLTSCKEDPVPEDTTEPVAGFNFTADELAVTFVNTSTDADSYAWDFGDGQTSALETPAVVTYSEAGTYDVTLTATRDNGKTDEITKQVIVTVTPDPIAGFTYVASGLEVTFTNSSVNASSYEWNFGDESSIVTDESPVHTYAASGTYSVSLKAIEGELNNEISMDVVVSVPTASFNVVVAGLEVTITNTSENATSYAWDYGDTNTSNEAGETHTYTYAAGGAYTITLVATDDATLTSEATEAVTVVAPANDPTVFFTYAVNDKAVTFTVVATDAVSYSWDLDDGQTSASEDPGAITYATYGWKTVTLTATGGAGTTPAVYTSEVPVASVQFINGTFDDYGDSNNPDYQKNNDDWEDPSGWDDPDFKAGSVSSDGRKLPDGTKTTGMKFSDNKRGLYQEIAVEVGKSYRVSFDYRNEAFVDPILDKLMVYLLSGPIASETEIIDDGTGADNVYTKIAVQSAPDADHTSKDDWYTLTLDFTATTTSMVFFLKSIEPTTSSATEIFVDNVFIADN